MKRNGKVDFLRFLFALFIMFLHFGYRPKLDVGGFELSLAMQGNFGVNFFFVVSGYLLTSSVIKMNRYQLDEGSNSKQNGLFLIKKYKHYMTWYLPAFILVLILSIIEKGAVKSAILAIKSFPSLLLLGSVGFSSGTESIGYYVGASWYLSALFVSEILLLPLIRRNYKTWIYCLAPIVLCVSFAIQINGYSDRILRAIMPMTLGTLCYEAVCIISEKQLDKWLIALMRVTEVTFYVIIFLYMCSDLDSEITWGMIFLVAVAVLLSFCPQTQYVFFERPVFNYLGKLSFPLYLLHPQVLNWWSYVFNKYGVTLSDHIKYPIMYIISIVISMVAYTLMEYIKRIRKLRSVEGDKKND